MSISVTDWAPSLTRLRGGITTDVPRPDDDDILPHLRLIELAFTEEIEGGDRPLMTGDRDDPRLLRPYGDNDGIILSHEVFRNSSSGERVLQVFCSGSPPQALQLMVQNLVGNPVPGDRRRDLSPEAFANVVDDRVHGPCIRSCQATDNPAAPPPMTAIFRPVAGPGAGTTAWRLARPRSATSTDGRSAF